jgi:hypothetical protein
MARTLKRVALALGLLGLAVLAAGAWALRRLDTPEGRKSLAARAGAALGTQVRVSEVEIGLLTGVRLTGVGVANPPPQRGDLLTAEAVSLRHRLWPLLRGRVVVDRLDVRKPTLSLVADARGVFNYERLGGARGAAAVPAALPLRVVLSRIAIDDGVLSVSDATRTTLLRVEGLEVQAGVEAGPEGARSDSRLRGSASSSGLAGTLVAEAHVETHTGSKPPTGQGRAHVEGCRAEKSALFSLLAAGLRLPELARPELDECRMEFRLGGGRVVTPLVSLKGTPAQLTGSGSVTLASGALDYKMELALHRSLIERVPAKELRAAFKDRGDGYGVVPFTLRGTTAQPQSDLTARLARAAVGEAAKGKLGKILDKVF